MSGQAHDPEREDDEEFDGDDEEPVEGEDVPTEEDFAGDESAPEGPVAPGTPAGTWHPERGPLTRIVAWVILILFLLCLGAMVVALVMMWR